MPNVPNYELFAWLMYVGGTYTNIFITQIYLHMYLTVNLCIKYVSVISMSAFIYLLKVFFFFY